METWEIPVLGRPVGEPQESIHSQRQEGDLRRQPIKAQGLECYRKQTYQCQILLTEGVGQ